jgi:hypothetical protein
MNILSELLNNLMLKLYFYVVGKEEISKYDGEAVEIRTVIHDVTYICRCTEVIFKAKPEKRIASVRVNRLYEVTMENTDTEIVTTGTYPVMCPTGFIYTNYPHMLAIRCHYYLTYN